MGDRCPVVIHPHLPGVIYANLKTNGLRTRTYVSFDDGKTFKPVELEFEKSECIGKYCGLELHLKCSMDIMSNNFPQKWAVKFDGISHKYGSTSQHIYISFNGGKSWNRLNSMINKVVMLNNGGLVFGTESPTGRIVFSYDEGNMWYYENINSNDIVDIIPLESQNNLLIAAINHKKLINVYSLFLFNFSKVISSLCLMSDRTCAIDDFETWYLPRYFGKCFQGQEMSYLKKKCFSMCVDSRALLLPTINPCPCAIEDFNWYNITYMSKPNYYYENNICVLDLHSNYTEPIKTCPVGAEPLIHLNGFTKLDSDFCIPLQTRSNEDSDSSDYCSSTCNCIV
ncbi:VPS10 domain-containing receptor SorCS3 [Thelohanellus kitauei]|uniref:VPS10 domain-containing receptor SorCS3 n=1 Tax=Thelohanellus kitauei TaxID=669202 RepID=A0A0C2IFW6_THEKT|nr:VPS10 domain-containing receptor SorCS3 [Thelohanellus kitauei]